MEPAEDPRRRRIRRMGVALALVVVLLALFAVGYVMYFDRVLRDPAVPPTPRSPPNPRVLMVEAIVFIGLLVAITAVVLRVRSRGPGPGKGRA